MINTSLACPVQLFLLGKCPHAEKMCISLSDGYPTDSLTRADMVSLLRGPSSSGLILTVSRKGLSHTRAVYMERRPLPQPPIKEACCAVHV